MGPNEWTIIGIFAVTQIVSFVWVVTSMKAGLLILKTQMVDVRDDLKKINDVLVELAVQKTRMDVLAERMQLLDTRYEELRHGEGFVFPLTRLNKGD